MVAIMGTSTCHVMNGDILREVPGMCGVVDGGITDGLWGYEAGQSGVGDIFNWFVTTSVPAAYTDEAAERGLSVHELLTEKAATQAVGEHGLVALDWHSGNRSVLVDHELSGMVLGQTLATRPEDTYRALLEATAFGTRVIVETFEAAGVPVTELVVAGGLLKNELLMQIYADVVNLAALHHRLRAGPGAGLGHPRRRRRRGVPGRGGSRPGDGPGEPWRLHAHRRQRGGLRRALRRVPCPARLLRPRRQPGHASAARRPTGGRMSPRSSTDTAIEATVQRLRAEVAGLHAELTRYQLVIWTAGNVSARVPGADLMVIKPSGVSYDELTADTMVVCDLDGILVEGDRSPSSDTAAHAYVYRHLPEVGGVVHTHSTYATAWASRGEAIPCVLTMIADEFGGEVPVGPFALIGDDSIGRGIVETLSHSRSPAVLMQNHGPFTVGPDARAAVKAAVMVEDVARTVHVARQLGQPLAMTQADVDALHHRYQHAYGQSGGPA